MAADPTPPPADRARTLVDLAGPATAFAISFAVDHPFGFLAGVRLPPGKEPVPDDVLDRLDPREALVARTLTGFRQIDWVGGRLAAGVAGRHLGATAFWLGAGAKGEPVPPPPFSASVSHKRSLAIALVARGSGADLGVDLEDDVLAARGSADLVLSDHERAIIDGLAPDERDRARVLAFALKEAVYKALSPRLGTPLGYHDAFVAALPGGRATLTMQLEGVARQPDVEVSFDWIGPQVIAAVRAPRRSPSQTPSNSAR